MIKLVLAYMKIYSMEIIRNRSAIFFILLFPTLLMLMVGQGNSNQHGGLTYLASFVVFCNYSVQTVAFQSLGMRIAEARHSDWTLFVKCLPTNVSIQFAGRILSMLLLALASMFVMMFAAKEMFNIVLTFSQWIWLVLIAILGGIPMGLLAIAIGYRVNPMAARSVFVIVNLGLLFAGFTLPNRGDWGIVREFVPTYQWLQLSLSHILPHVSSFVPWLAMLGFSILFFVLAVLSYHKQTNLRHA